MPRHLPAHLQSYRAYQQHKRVIRMTDTELGAEKSRPSSVCESPARLLYTSLIDWVEDFINTQLDLRSVTIDIVGE